MNIKIVAVGKIKEKFTKRIPSKDIIMLKSGVDKFTNQVLLKAKNIVYKNDSTVAVSNVIEKVLGSFESITSFLSRKNVRVTKIHVAIKFNKIYVILVTYLCNHHCNVIMKLFISIVFHD